MYKRNFILFLILIFYANCRSVAIYQGDEKPVILAAKSDKCHVVSRKKQWSFLFGLVPVNKVGFGKLSHEAGYRIERQYTWVDVLLSVVGGFYSTLHVNTIKLSRCSEEFVVLDKKEYAKRNQDHVYNALGKYALARTMESIDKNEPIIILTNGTSLRGIILEIRADRVVVGQTKQVQIDNDIAAKDWIFLKNGSVLFTQKTRQDAERMVFEQDGSSGEIPISEIKRVKYAAKRKKTENSGYISAMLTQFVATEDIERILLYPEKELESMDGVQSFSGMKRSDR